jgi:hypothetical protein
VVKTSYLCQACTLALAASEKILLLLLLAKKL